MGSKIVLKTALQPGFRTLPLREERIAARWPGLDTTLEVFVLIVLIAVFGLFEVPSHWTSIWMDREFTGWVAPIANRLSQGLRLYADGGHIPMPPLPFVLLHWISHGRAIWLTESLCNFVFQALTLLVTYFALRPLLRRPLPFLATLAAMPIFFSLPKTIAYDSIAQFHVAVLGALIVWHSRTPALPAELLAELKLHPPGIWSIIFSPALILMGLVTASCLLSKQSTGTGAFLGTMCALACFSSRSRMARLGHASAFIGWTAFMFALLALALSPWIDVPGLIRDVFLTGSEPKGGSLRLVRSLCVYSLEIGQHALVAAITILAALGVARLPLNVGGEDAGAESEPKRSLVLIYLAALLAPIVVLCLSPLAKEDNRLIYGMGTVAIQMLWTGLMVGLLLVGRVLLSMRLSSPKASEASLGDQPTRLAGLGTLLFLSAIFHSLSTPRFRWIYDNNPLIVFAAAVFFAVVLDYLNLAVPTTSRRNRWIFVGVVFAAFLFPWASSGVQLGACNRCTQSWPEVGYLDGARLAETSKGMRKLVALVRKLAPNAGTDATLLLPNDPNVEAWFERPRPQLSSPIIFADQYWDRYVDGDVAALHEQLPRVIVVGPTKYWRNFHRIWQRNCGAERLIDAVRKEILPEHYALQQRMRIRFQGRWDYMDVYVRRKE
jgi:hypothetical protein